MNYKDTLNLPKTTFPIAPKFAANEQTRYREWDSRNIYGSWLVPDFVLHDGPPYANGDIHIGHALNKILKDFIVKRVFFANRTKVVDSHARVSFVPGWDCHGLPIEQKAKGNFLNVTEQRASCRQFAADQVKIQKDQFKKLGVVASWDSSYETMSHQYELKTYQTLIDLVKKGLIYRAKKPVYWSWAMQTALAESEIEYKDREDNSIYVRFAGQVASFQEREMQRQYTIPVWTTTPWTLPANVMLSAAKCNYIETKLGTHYFLIAEPAYKKQEWLGNPTGNIYNWDELSKVITGVKSPLSIQWSKLVFSDSTDPSKGTGFVHIAPGHGPEDYQIALANGIKNFPMDVNQFGHFKFDEKTIRRMGVTDGLYDIRWFIKDKHVFDCNELIINRLKHQDCLLAEERVTHSYPHCWRSGKPVIFRSTEQWFLDLDKIREDVLEAVDHIHFDNDSAKDKLKQSIKDRPDWCLSRQRVWGVPLGLITNKTTGEFNLNYEYAAGIFEKEGFDCWWTDPVEKFLPPELDPNDYEKTTDILDVWFDSGISRIGRPPADVYLEGVDQYRGWFQSSLWLYVAKHGQAPCKRIISHGFVMDGRGEKMAKSKGNVVSPLDVIDKYGAEVLRYWVASTDYTKELKINHEILKRSEEGYRKIRNTIRYMLANIGEVEPLAKEDLSKRGAIYDHWIINETQTVFEEINAYFSDYKFYLGIQKLNEFINTRLSNIYMNAIKDRLYCCAADSTSRISAQLTLATILHKMLFVLAPVLTYTVEEALLHAPEWFAKKASIARSVFDCMDTTILKYLTSFDSDYWVRALDAFHVAFDKLKKAGEFKDTLEVMISQESYHFKRFDPRPCSTISDSPEDWFGVSGWINGKVLNYKETFEVDGDVFYIIKGFNKKCERCWKRCATGDAGLCGRCENVIH